MTEPPACVSRPWDVSRRSRHHEGGKISSVSPISLLERHLKLMKFTMAFCTLRPGRYQSDACVHGQSHLGCDRLRRQAVGRMKHCHRCPASGRTPTVDSQPLAHLWIPIHAASSGARLLACLPVGGLEAPSPSSAQQITHDAAVSFVVDAVACAAPNVTGASRPWPVVPRAEGTDRTSDWPQLHGGRVARKLQRRALPST